MKMLLLISLMILVLDANGSSFQNFFNPGNGVQNLNDEDQGPADEDHYITFGPESQDSTDEYATDGSGESQDMDSDIENQRWEKEEKWEFEGESRKSKCKPKNICVSMRGKCVTNATLCSGKLIPKGCKGPSCQCCVPKSLENQIHNLTNLIQSLQTKLNSTNVKMDYYAKNADSLNKKTASEIQSLKTGINGIKLNMESKIKALDDKVMKSISVLNATIRLPGCPEGFFTAGSWQCFKYFNKTKLSWTSAKAKCQSEGLVIAKPSDPVSLRHSIMYYDSSYYTWIGARGAGSYYKWDRDGQSISNSDSLWHSGEPASYSTSYCLVLNAGTAETNQPYRTFGCSNARPFVCERVMN